MGLGSCLHGRWTAFKTGDAWETLERGQEGPRLTGKEWTACVESGVRAFLYPTYPETRDPRRPGMARNSLEGVRRSVAEWSNKKEESKARSKGMRTTN